MVFLFKQMTADGLRISDWSSEVCSSDLEAVGDDLGVHAGGEGERRPGVAQVVRISQHRQAAPSHQRLEAASHGIRVERLTLRRAEDERRWAEAEQITVPLLGLLVIREDPDGVGDESQAAAAADRTSTRLNS